MSEIRLEKDDVRVRSLEILCEDCEESLATHTVTIDFRSAGVGRALGKYCRPCAVELRERIQESLPGEESQ